MLKSCVCLCVTRVVQSKICYYCRCIVAGLCVSSSGLPATDEIDAIATKRENAQREMERRIVAQMLTCMDDLAGPPPSAQPPTEGSDTPLPEPATSASRHVVIIGELPHSSWPTLVCAAAWSGTFTACH